MIAIQKEIQRCIQNGLSGVIGTIISTEGSTYQKTGAKCFIHEDGKITGLLSGGCVEGDLKEYAFQIIESGIPQIVEYDFQDEGDLVWGLGLGCNGKMDIFLEPFLPKQEYERAVSIDAYYKAALMKPMHCITIIRSAEQSLVGTKWMIDPESEEFPEIENKEILIDYLHQRETLKNGRSMIEEKCELQVFYECTTPPPQLMIFGAGPDAVPIVRMAKSLNWQVTVLDYRPAFATEENFPEADRLLIYPAGTAPVIELNRNSYVILMTHNFLQDQLILEHILTKDAAYIGLLGPRKRTNELIKTSMSLEMNMKIDEIHSPIGLDIGSKTPEEIALSIIAEIMLVYRGGTGSRLSDVKSHPLVETQRGCEVLLNT
ncbi:XdhC family protein [Jeotgalibacillus soli]|uniref:Xanthine dehydrogenase n=1 Tax=Jeotgalibacillus soli TaxID=889306 RepID=A0A0C2VKV0_9BACL|nr:XdhC/CoxI family protein [Jeotgalibacillus soli]KIL45066.1 xanthine dehydrogenase [Jeotgalibacillus soli]